jgi:hypothetical protein
LIGDFDMCRHGDFTYKTGKRSITVFTVGEISPNDLKQFANDRLMPFWGTIFINEKLERNRSYKQQYKAGWRRIHRFSTQPVTARGEAITRKPWKPIPIKPVSVIKANDVQDLMSENATIKFLVKKLKELTGAHVALYYE